jgi:hypothetical protein
MAATLGTGKLRPGGISGDRLGLAGPVTESGREVPTSTHQESKYSTSEDESRVVKRSKRKRRKEDIPVVPTSSGCGEAVSISSDVGTATSNRRISLRNKRKNIVTNATSLGDIGDTSTVCKDVCKMMSATVGDVEKEIDPSSTNEALAGSHRREWEESIDAENRALYDRQVFEVVRKPKGVHLLGSRYIHVIKRKLGEADRRKTRLVVLGCGQRRGIDYNETFAPVAKAASIRILFALAQVYKLHIHQMDVDTAFLYAPLEESIYMRPPVGMKGIPHDYCLRLKKSLYGLKQAPLNFNNHIDEFITDMGFKKCILDNCMYVMMLDTAKIVLALYVDDIILVGDDLTVIEDIKSEFKETFQMKDLGEMKNYLGMRITRSADSLVVDQTQYATDVVKRFSRLLSTKKDKYPKAVPFYRDLKLTRTERMSKGQMKYAKNFPFQEVMGSLLYLAINTRPDIAYAVSVLCRFNNNPTFSACRGAVRLLYYIRRTLDYGIQYSGDQLYPEGWSDSDFGGDLDTRRSRTGSMMCLANGPISWKIGRAHV